MKEGKQESMDASERLQRSWERRRRTLKRYKKMALTGMALTFAAGVAIGWVAGSTSEKEAEAPAETAYITEQSGPRETWVPVTTAVPTTPPETPVPITTDTPETPEPTAADLWSDCQSRIDTPLLIDAALDPETQWAIFEVCGQDASLFCATMAIAYTESRYATDLIGDDGLSFGMMQINVKWHTERMERLGVTDLTDPVQNATVAIDYLLELESRYGFEPESDGILMAYNMGPAGAMDARRAGRTSTNYSTAVLEVYRDYLEEMEWAR